MTALPDDDFAEVDRAEDDFLAFWDEHRSHTEQPTRRILGIDVPVPDDMPLAFDVAMDEVQHSESVEDVKRLLAMIFPRDVIDAWMDRGLTLKQMQVLLAWGMSCGSGNVIEFAAAAEIVAKAEAAKAEGKATGPNRAARRASSKTRASAGTGRSSKPTSRANTA